MHFLNSIQIHLLGVRQIALSKYELLDSKVKFKVFTTFMIFKNHERSEYSHICLDDFVIGFF